MHCFMLCSVLHAAEQFVECAGPGVSMAAGGRTENGFTSEMPGPHKPDKCDILLAAKRASPPCTSGFVTATLPHLFTCALACSDVLDVFTERLSGYQQILVRPPAWASIYPTQLCLQAHLHVGMSFSMWSAVGHQLPRIFLQRPFSPEHGHEHT